MFSPGIIYESQRTWQDRAETGKMYRIPLCVLTDKTPAERAPMSGGKATGDVIRLPVPEHQLVKIRNRLVPDFRKSKKIKVVYLSRQGTGRILRDADHARLKEGLERLGREEEVEPVVESLGVDRKDFIWTKYTPEPVYEKLLPFEEQLKAVADADVSVCP